MILHEAEDQFGSLEKMAMAFFKMSRSILSRSFSRLSWRICLSLGGQMPRAGKSFLRLVGILPDPFVERVGMNPHVSSNLRYAVAAIRNQLDRFDLELAGNNVFSLIP